MKDKLVLLAREKGYYSFHTVNREQGSGWFIELCLLQKWLREVHNIEVEVYREVDFADECYYNTYCVDVFNNKLSFQSKDSIFTERIDTYEQALEQGLLEGLKLIDNETSTG